MVESFVSNHKLNWAESASLVEMRFKEIDSDQSGALSEIELNGFSKHENSPAANAAANLSNHVTEISRLALSEKSNDLPMAIKYNKVGAKLLIDDNRESEGITQRDLQVMKTMHDEDRLGQMKSDYRFTEISNGFGGVMAIGGGAIAAALTCGTAPVFIVEAPPAAALLGAACVATVGTVGVGIEESVRNFSGSGHREFARQIETRRKMLSSW